MSIAVSADIKPSRLLLILMVVMAMMVAAIGELLAFAWSAHLSFIIRISLAIICVGAAGVVFWLILHNRKAVWLHVSGTGQIRLLEHHITAHSRSASQVMRGGVAQLLAGSTIWSSLLVLRLRLENGCVRTIAILPDSVSQESFQALQVACRWVASHNGKLS